MKIKLFDSMYTNELLLSILPFGTGYLLKKDNTEGEEDMPCENSVAIAMMFRSVEFAIHPHKTHSDDHYHN